MWEFLIFLISLVSSFRTHRCKFEPFLSFVFSEFRPPPMLPPSRGGGGASSSSSTSRTTSTRPPPYYTTPRPLLTTSPGQRHRTTSVRQPVLVPASGASSDTNQIIDTKHKSGRSPPVQLLPPAPQPPARPPQEFCSPRVNADISWPRTQQGQTAKQPCPVGILGTGTSMRASAKFSFTGGSVQKRNFVIRL